MAEKISQEAYKQRGNDYKMARIKVVKGLMMFYDDWPCQHCESTDNYVQCDMNKCGRWEKWFRKSWKDIRNSLQILHDNKVKRDHKITASLRADTKDISTPDRFTEGF